MLLFFEVQSNCNRIQKSKAKGKQQEGEIFMRHKFRRMIALMLAFVMSFSVLLVPAAAFSFEDVPGGAWYAQAVSYVYEKGWMLGVSDTKFAPQQELTRGMFVTVLARIADAKADNNSPAFSDTAAGKWFTGAASWAAGEGIVNGVGDGKFAPYRNITRQDLCTMIYRYLHAKGLDESLRATQDTVFVDSAYVSAYAKDAVNFCASVGLVAGFSEKDGTLTFRPGATATRAQTAMILMRLDRLLKGESPNPEPMPAQSFSEDCGDGMRVSVNAPKGALPEGTELQVTPVTDERVLADFHAVVGGNLLAVADISFLRDGRELEPLTEVEVQMALSGLETAEAPAVYHIRKDGTPEPVEAELLSQSRAPGDAVLRFSAKDFSVYVISDTPPSTAELTVEFYDVDGSLFNTQKLRAARIHNAAGEDELVYDPGLPGFGSDAGEKSFEGWYQAESAPSYTVLNENIGNGVSVRDINSRIKEDYDSISSDTTIKFYPLVYYVARLNYCDQKGALIATQTKPIPYTAQNTAGSSADVEVNRVYTPLSESQHFDGVWVLNNGAVTPGMNPTYNTNDSDYTTYENGHSITVNRNAPVELIPHLQVGYWLNFDMNIEENGIALGFPEDDTPADAITPHYVDAGDVLTESVLNSLVGEPHRAGYLFVGWYLDARMQTPAFPTGGSSITMDHDLTLYAKWGFGQSSYAKTYWVQWADDATNATDAQKHYSLDSLKAPNGQAIEKVTGVTTGATVSMSAAEIGADRYGVYHAGMCAERSDDDYYFTLNDANSKFTARVRGDGTTVLSRKLDRKVITVKYLKKSAVETLSNYTAISGTPATYDLNRFYVRVSGNTFQPVFPRVTNYTGVTDPNAVPAANVAFTPSAPNRYLNIDGLSAEDFHEESGLYGSRWIIPAALDSWTTRWSTFCHHEDTWGIYSYWQELYEVYDVFGGTSDGINRDRTTLFLWTNDSSDVANTNIYKYTMRPDGTYSTEARTAHPYPNTEVYFYLSEQNPFELYSYHNAADETPNAEGGTKFDGDGKVFYANSAPYLTIYFARKQYTIRFMQDESTTLREEDLYFEAPISSATTDYVPESAPEGYYFDGWFMDLLHSVPAEWPETMPCYNLQVYAKWTPVKYRVCMDFYQGLSEEEAAQVSFADRGRTSSWLFGEGQLAPEGRFDASWKGHYIEGWYSDPDFQHRYDFSTPLSASVPGMDMTYGVQQTGESDSDFITRMQTYGTRCWKDQISGADNDDRWFGDPADGLEALREANPDAVPIRGRLILYAKWVESPENNAALRVRYLADHSSTEQGRFGYKDVNDPPEDIYDDPQTYTDGAEVFAQPASTPLLDTLRFRLWELLDSDGEATGITVAPGQTFFLDLANAIRELIGYDGSGYTPWSPLHTHDANPTHYTEAQAPTCTAAGHPAGYYCAGCGCYFADSACTNLIEGNYEALGHNWALPENQCILPGVMTYHCTNPGCTATKKGVQIETLHRGLVTHDTVRPADCEYPAIQAGWVECTTCGAFEGNAVEGSSALGHIYDDGEVTTAPSCTAYGVKTYTCTREGCHYGANGGAATRTERIDKMPHSYSGQTVSVSWSGIPNGPVDWNQYPSSGVTCTATVSCSVCHAETSQTVPATAEETSSPLGHDGLVTYTANFTEVPFEGRTETKTLVLNQRPAYLITYHSHEGTHTATCPIGESFTVNYSPSGTPTGGEEFMGYWITSDTYNSSDEPSAKYINGSSVITPEGDVDLYAVYRRTTQSLVPTTINDCFIPVTSSSQLEDNTEYVISTSNEKDSGRMLTVSANNSPAYTAFTDSTFVEYQNGPILTSSVSNDSRFTLTSNKLQSKKNANAYVVVILNYQVIYPSPQPVSFSDASAGDGTVIIKNSKGDRFLALNNNGEFVAQSTSPSSGAYIWKKVTNHTAMVDGTTYSYVTLTSSSPNVQADPSGSAPVAAKAAEALLQLREERPALQPEAVRLSPRSPLSVSRLASRIAASGEAAPASQPSLSSPSVEAVRSAGEAARIYEKANVLEDGARYLLLVELSGGSKLLTNNYFYESFAPRLQDVTLNGDELTGNYTAFELVAHRNANGSWKLSNDALGDLCLEHTGSHALKFGSGDVWWSWDGSKLTNACNDTAYPCLSLTADDSAAGPGTAAAAATVRFFKLRSTNTHTLTVRYLDPDGQSLWESYVGVYEEGETYSLLSPTINGYTPNATLTQGVVGDANIVVTVTYSPNNIPAYEDGWWELETGELDPDEDYLMVLYNGSLPLMVQPGRAYVGENGQLERYREYTLLGETVRGGYLAMPYPLCNSERVYNGSMDSSDPACVISTFDQFVEYDSEHGGAFASNVGWFEDGVAQTDFESCIVRVQEASGTENRYRIVSGKNPNYLLTWDLFGAYFDNNGGDIWEYDYDTHMLTTYYNPVGHISLKFSFMWEDLNKNGEPDAGEYDPWVHLYNCNESSIAQEAAQVYFFKRHRDENREFSVTFLDADNSLIDRTNVFDGATLSTALPAAPYREGSTFNGWVDQDGNPVSGEETVTRPLTLTASYTSHALETYTIYLRAVYGPGSSDGTTNIYWYANNETAKNNGAGARVVDQGIYPGESAARIPLPVSNDESFHTWSEAAPSRIFYESEGSTAAQNPEVGLSFPGRRFLGWARVETSGSGATSAPHPELDSLEDCYLIWNGDGTYSYNDGTRAIAQANYVTADGISPNFEMYAVWEPVFYVFHSSTGELVAYNLNEARDANGRFNLVDHVEPGYLYGGYYSAYGYISSEQMDTVIGSYSGIGSSRPTWNLTPDSSADPGKCAVTTLTAGQDNLSTKQTHVSDNFATYDGHCRYTNGGNSPLGRDSQNKIIRNTPIWNMKENACTDPGNALRPSAGAVFYLKEVPSYYLSSKLCYTYDSKDSNHLIDLWLTSVVDDGNYRDVGFYCGTAENFEQILQEGYLTRDALAASFKLSTHAEPEHDLVVNAENFYSGTTAENASLRAGYIAVKHYQNGVSALAENPLMIMASWVTPDNITITNNTTRWSLDSEKEDVAEGKLLFARAFNGLQDKLYFNLNVTQNATTWAIQSGETVYQQFALFTDGERTELVELSPVPGKDGLYSCIVPAGVWQSLTLRNFAPDVAVTQSTAANQQSAALSFARYENKLQSFDPAGGAGQSWCFAAAAQTGSNN